MTPLALAATQPEASTSFATLMDHVAQVFEGFGAVVLIVGVVWSFILAAMALRRTSKPAVGYTTLRQAFGRSLLLGLEILVAADLIRTVAVAPTVMNVLVLGMIVLIRTFLVFSLETEIQGVLPWRRAQVPGLQATGPQTAGPPAGGPQASGPQA